MAVYVPKEYVAESVVRSLKKKVKGKRVLLVRAKVARDVIPRELRKAGAEVDVWQASADGVYENRDPSQADMNLRGKLTTDADGRFWFSTVKMKGYAIPIDTLVGRMLAAQGRLPGVAKIGENAENDGDSVGGRR